jgi:hypothetical protein
MIALNQNLYLLQGNGIESIHRSENDLIAMRPVSHLTNIGGVVKIIVRNFAGTKLLMSLPACLMYCIHMPVEKREGVFCVHSE